jgi:hypothetical protein
MINQSVCKIIINTSFFFSFGLFFYFIGIFIKYLNLNIFETHLFTTVMVIYGFFSSIFFGLFDIIRPKETLNNINKLNVKEKIILFGSCVPYYKLLVLSYIDLDPVIIQLLNCCRVALNPIIYTIYYKESYLLNIIIIICIIINISSCIIPFIFNDNFSLKLNNINFGLLGLIYTIIGVVLTSFNNIINEKFQIKYDFDNIYGYNIFIITTFIFTDLIFSILLTPIIACVQYFIINNKIILLDNFYKIITFSSIIGLFYGPYFIIITKAYLKLSSINISIINNIVLIFTILISCLLNLSIFYYLYIPAVILIFITSIIIIYKSEILKNNVIIF